MSTKADVDFYSENDNSANGDRRGKLDKLYEATQGEFGRQQEDFREEGPLCCVLKGGLEDITDQGAKE